MQRAGHLIFEISGSRLFDYSVYPCCTGATLTFSFNFTPFPSTVNSNLLFYPDLSNVVAELNTAGQNYTVDQSGYVIGTIKGEINGWANIRNSKNINYFLALSGDINVPTAVCIPFKKGDTVSLGSIGTYNLVFIGAK